MVEACFVVRGQKSHGSVLSVSTEAFEQVSQELALCVSPIREEEIHGYHLQRPCFCDRFRRNAEGLAEEPSTTCSDGMSFVFNSWQSTVFFFFLIRWEPMERIRNLGQIRLLSVYLWQQDDRF